MRTAGLLRLGASNKYTHIPTEGRQQTKTSKNLQRSVRSTGAIRLAHHSMVADLGPRHNQLLGQHDSDE